MSFRPESLRGAQPGTPRGQIDYRLVRKHVIDEFKRGRLSRLDVCDAHPELLRAARNVGQRQGHDCPICEDDEAVLVSFVFGPGLPAHGRCITSSPELARLSRRGNELSCYVVEVCPSCSWNHLVRNFAVGGPSRRSGATAQRP